MILILKIMKLLNIFKKYNSVFFKDINLIV
jgi:hypothetical protein